MFASTRILPVGFADRLDRFAPGWWWGDVRAAESRKELARLTIGGDVAAAYDLIYVRAAGKDYQGEASDIAALIRERCPAAGSLLDVACGTGRHLSYLRTMFAHVEEVELAASMRAAAARDHRPRR